MIILPKGNPSAPLSVASPYKAPSRDLINQTPPSDNSFDQVNISRESSTTDRFCREWVSRLVKEVRTCHTANDIKRIKSEVQSGSYQPDVKEIAAKILLEENSRADF